MIKLQNNYTTPEQSKRLLELGVPEDSADCYLLRTHTKGDTFIVEVLHDELYSKMDKFERLLEYLPCWSVGRLIEIFELCSGVLWQDTAQPSVKQPILIERVIGTIVLFNKHSHMNFSKLED